MLDYIRDAAEIYRQSFATIRAEADLTPFPEDVARVVVRLIHTCGQVDVAEHVAFTPGVVDRDARRPARRRADPVRLVHGRGRDHRRAAARPATRWCRWSPTRAPPELARRRETTRSAAGVELWADRLAGAVLAIGNAPTALFRLLELVDDGVPAPGVGAGRPGRVRRLGAVQAGADRPDPRGMEYLVVRGRRGGSAMAAAAVNAIASERE